MKKLLEFLFLVAALTLFMSSCEKSTPSKAYQSYVELLKKGDYKTFAQNFSINDSLSAEDQAKQVDLYESIITDKVDKKLKEKNGLKEMQVLEETFSEDGNKAILKVKFIYGDGTEEESTQEMVKQKGQWKMVFNK